MGKRKKVNSKSKKNNKKSVKKTVAPKLKDDIKEKQTKKVKKDDDKKEVKSSKNTKSKGATKKTETKSVNNKKVVVKTSKTTNKKEIKVNLDKEKKESSVDDNQSINLKKMKRHNVIRMILIVILSCVFIFCVFKITVNQIEMFIGRRESKSLIERVVKFPDKKNDDGEDIKEPDVQIDFNELKSINSDTVGWMIFNNEVINNPLVHTTNNAYYLNHTFNKRRSVVGTIFMDYRNTSFDDRNVVLFGHSNLDRSMFGSLGDVFKQGYFDKEDADIIKIYDTNNKLIKYQIFSYYIIESEEYYITTYFASDASFQSFINTIKRRSYVDRGIEVTTSDNILTLSTCAGDETTSKRRVIHAKRIN